MPLLRSTAVLLLALLVAPPAPAQIETLAPGPFAVGSAEWNFGPLTISEPGGGGGSTIEVEHFGTVRYPAVTDGVSAFPSSAGPFPFVVFAHGRYQVAPFIGSNHLQAGYLIEHLASWGFVVASVNLDVVGDYALPSAIKQRGELITATAAAFGQLDPAGLVLDLQRVALVGHSRGGEGCLSAWNAGNLPNIVGIATIAPTSFASIALDGPPYLGLYGSKDGDVNNGWPIMVHDRVLSPPTALQYIEGANHFWFTETITFSGEGAADITREQHHDIARTYIAAFLRAVTHDPPLSFAELCDGPSLAPLTDALEIHPLYRDARTLVVNDFEDLPADAASNSLGGVSAGDLLPWMDEQSLQDNAATLYHLTQGLKTGHDLGAGAAYYVEELPGGLDASGFGQLSVELLQRWGAPSNASGQAQDAKLVLMDGDHDLAWRRLSHYGEIPWPATHGGAFPKKSVLRTTRVPLADFVAANPSLDLTNLRFVALVFDLTPASELRVDRIAFTD